MLKYEFGHSLAGSLHFDRGRCDFAEILLWHFPIGFSRAKNIVFQPSSLFRISSLYTVIGLPYLLYPSLGMHTALVFNKSVSPITYICAVITITGESSIISVILWKCRALHGSPLSAFLKVLLFFSFSNFVGGIITITGETFTNSELALKCRALHFSPFTLILILPFFLSF